MKTIREYSLAFVLASFLLVSGCDSETKTIVCNCEGTLTMFENYRGIVAFSRTDQFIIVSDQLGFVVPCEGFDSAMMIDGEKIIFSGTYISNCTEYNTSYGINTFNVQLSSIERSDTIYSKPPLKIEIIKSEDYGYPVGFGYRLEYKNTFKILQPILPGVGGLIPFSTTSDAFKVAIRTGYRISKENDLPSTPLTDLYYLRIIN